MLAYDDLVATLRNLRSMYLEWRRVVASGRSHRQRQSLEIEGHARHIRWYETWVVPGLLQTSAYATAIFTARQFLIPGGRDDIAEAVVIRMTRQRILQAGTRRFAFVLAEAALHQTIGSPEIMADQLRALADHAANSRVDLSVLPLDVIDAGVGSHGFVMFDRDSVMIENISAELTITRPSEIAVYDDAFALLHSSAAHGRAALDIIARIEADHRHRSR